MTQTTKKSSKVPLKPAGFKTIAQPPARSFCFAEHPPVEGDRRHLLGIAHLHCEYDFATPGDHLRAIRDSAPACIEHLRQMPEGARAVYLIWFMAFQCASKQWGHNADGSLRYSPAPDPAQLRAKGIDTRIPREQMTLFGAMLRKAGVPVDLVYIDQEEDLDRSVPNQYVVRGWAMQESLLLGDPLAMPSLRGSQKSPMVCNFNFCNPSDLIPAQSWWGPLVDASIDGSSCPEAYFTWSARYAGAPNHWLWCAFVDAINAIRCCSIRCGAHHVVPWLSGPVSKVKIGHAPDSPIGQNPDLWEAATWLTEQFIYHAAALGVRYFGLANYMIDDAERPKVEARVEQAIANASNQIVRVRQIFEVSINSSEICTGRYTTSYSQFLDRLPKGSR